MTDNGVISKGKTNWGLIVTMMALCAIPEIALAAPWDGPIQQLIDLLTGTTARLAAILAVIILGFLAMSGRMSWGLAGSVIFGLILVFGSAWIVDTFIGSVST